MPDVLKPDVIAPGEEILAAHVDSAGYKMLSGVSMATAHAAGAAALLIDLHPGWSPAEVQSALQTTALADAVTIEDWDGPIPADAFAAGSGRLNLSAAARAGLVLDESAAAFEAANPYLGGDPETLNLASLADSLCVVSCGWTRTVRSTRAVTTHWTVSVQTPAGVGLTVVPSSFTLGPGATQVLQITASGTSSLEGWTHGRVVLTETGGLAPTAHLPVEANWVPQYSYTVVKGGTGSGRVTSSPAGIDCGSDCSEMFVEDTYVTLTATADPGSIFVGWDGDCWGGSWNTCSDYIWYNQTATAYFNPPYPDKPLSNQVARKEAIDGPVEGGTWAWFYADVESGAGELVVDLFDLSGDVQLYVRRAQKPDWSNYTCTDWDYYGTPNRRCVITLPAAGRWWIGVNNEQTGRVDYSVRASWGTAADEALANGVPKAGYVSAAEPGGLEVLLRRPRERRRAARGGAVRPVGGRRPLPALRRQARPHQLHLRLDGKLHRDRGLPDRQPAGREMVDRGEQLLGGHGQLHRAGGLGPPGRDELLHGGSLPAGGHPDHAAAGLGAVGALPGHRGLRHPGHGEGGVAERDGGVALGDGAPGPLSDGRRGATRQLDELPGGPGAGEQRSPEPGHRRPPGRGGGDRRGRRRLGAPHPGCERVF